MDNAKEITLFLDLPERAIVKTSLCNPYDLDDDLVVPVEQLLFRQKLELCTSQSQRTNPYSGKNDVCNEKESNAME